LENEQVSTTNTKLLTSINNLKNDIDEYFILCGNISSLKSVNDENVKPHSLEADDLKELLNEVVSKIDEMKNLQLLINERNLKFTITINNECKTVAEWIKIKEGLVLKKSIYNIVFSNQDKENSNLTISMLEIFQEMQQYKHRITAIQKELDKFNSQLFKI
jgi:hypothetical protein